MTPEEILAECPEFVLPLDYKQRKMPWEETRHFPFQIEYEEGYVRVLCRQFGDAGKALIALAQSRKEVRELREENDHLKRQLYWFTGGPVNG